MNTLIELNSKPDYFEIAKKYILPQGTVSILPTILFESQLKLPLTKKSISLMIAKPKAEKTTIAAWIAGIALKATIRVLYVDTEQGPDYGQRTQDIILRVAGLKSSLNLTYLDLKTCNVPERVKIIESLLKKEDYDLVIIDGIRDLVFDYNSPKETQEIATNLMNWASTKNVHLLTILHKNKTSEDAKGHLGTELINKSEIVLEISFLKTKQMVVTAPFTRGKPFDGFALRLDDDGFPHLIADWQLESCPSKEKKLGINKLKNPKDYLLEEHKAILQQVFQGESELTSSEFYKSFIKFWKKDIMSHNRAKIFYSYYQDEKFIIALRGQIGNRTLLKLHENYG